jgi:hypothetical protein
MGRLEVSTYRNNNNRTNPLQAEPTLSDRSPMTTTSPFDKPPQINVISASIKRKDFISLNKQASDRRKPSKQA